MGGEIDVGNADKNAGSSFVSFVVDERMTPFDEFAKASKALGFFVHLLYVG